MDPSLSSMISSYISSIDRLLVCDEALRDCSLQEMADRLLDAIRDDGSVSYLLDNPRRYRTTPLSSVIDALFDADMLPEQAIQIMQNKLFDCRDLFQQENLEEDDFVTKQPEDMDAWSVDEGPSVWTTSKVVYTLVSTGFAKSCTLEQRKGLEKAIVWLDKQKYLQESGAYAWGFQKSHYSDCAPSIPMTALALKAFGITYEHKADVHNGDRKRVKHSFFSTYIHGVQYLKENVKWVGNKCYWEYKGKPSITATVWALEALETLKKDQRDVQIITQSELQEIMQAAINWVIDDAFPVFSDESDCCEPSEPFFEYTQTKYKIKEKKRVFYSFVPYFAAFLIKHGISPFHPKVCACVRWLIDNQEKHWAVNDYNVIEACSFSAAMALNVLVVWLKSVNDKTYKMFASQVVAGSDFAIICNNCDLHNHVNAVKTHDFVNDYQECTYLKKRTNSPSVPKFGYAVLFIATGAIIIVSLQLLFKDYVVKWLSNEALVQALKRWLVLVPTSLVALMVAKGVKMYHHYFHKKS